MRNIKPKTFLKYVLLLFVAVVTLYPLIWVSINSFRTNQELFSDPWGIPSTWHIENYWIAWDTAHIGIFFLNSVFVSITSLVISLSLTTTSSFAITRLKFKLSRAAFLVFTVGMMIPVHATLIPLFLMFSRMHLVNTHFALIIPYVAFSMPIAVMILTGFMKTFPVEIEEASIIDGSTITGMFVRITLPMCKSCIATVAIFNFMFMWNELNYALVFINSQSKMTLPLGMTSFKGEVITDFTSMFAAIMITITPMILMYILFNRQIIEGMTSGALKG